MWYADSLCEPLSTHAIRKVTICKQRQQTMPRKETQGPQFGIETAAGEYSGGKILTATSSTHPLRRPIPLLAIILAAVAIHGPLLLMQLPLGSYDAHFHIFFAS